MRKKINNYFLLKYWIGNCFEITKKYWIPIKNSFNIDKRLKINYGYND